MGRYFFSCEGYDNFKDEQGTELPDAREARLQAIAMAGEILADHPGDFLSVPAWRLFVNDEQGRTVFELNFSAKAFHEPGNESLGAAPPAAP